MSFPTAAYLRKATARAKSDVANKLVSMFLHELSRKITASLRLSVTDPTYANAVEGVFGSSCCYCGQPLEKDRASVEHLEGMNRFRLGLHIPGNVIVACKRCKVEKRRDDQLIHLTLAESGWESFLSHDSTRCKEGCKACSHWNRVWPNFVERVDSIRNARQRTPSFVLVILNPSSGLSMPRVFSARRSTPYIAVVKSSQQFKYETPSRNPLQA